MKKLCLLSLLLVVILTTAGCGSSGNSNSEKRNCIDVTSYDHDRSNDMKCTSSDGEVRYTSYEGAKTLMSL